MSSADVVFGTLEMVGSFLGQILNRRSDALTWGSVGYRRCVPYGLQGCRLGKLPGNDCELQG